MKKILQHIAQLHIIDNERKGWLFLSVFVSMAVLGIIFGWSSVRESHLIWLVVSLGMVLSVVWWYWTMRLIRRMLQFKREESEILLGIVKEIRYIKNKVIKDLTNK
jgi:predicted membrane channel-forming protein YqfA (hemolysin III family)